jgi:hypothetical protein
MWPFCSKFFLSDLIVFSLVFSVAVAQVTPAPLITTPSGTYTDFVSVQFSSGTSGETFFCEEFGNTDRALFQRCTSPLILQTGSDALLSNVTLQLFAQRPGFSPSPIVSRTFSIFQDLNVLPPVISVTLGAGTANVTLNSVRLFESTLYLLDDASNLTIANQRYSDPIIVTTPGPHTIRALTIKRFAKSGLSNSSAEVSRTFLVSQTAPPIVTPPDGVYATGVLQVQMQCSLPGCSLFYTIDGSIPVIKFSGIVAAPGNNATLPFSALTLLPGPRVVHGMAAYQGYASAPVRSLFDVVGLLPPPVLSPPSGTTLTVAPAAVSVTARNDSNVWIMIRPIPEPNRTVSTAFPSPEWTLLLNQTLILRGNSSVYVILDKLYYRPVVNITRADYFVTSSAIQPTPTSPSTFDALYLLFLLAAIPITASAYYLYKRKQQQRKEEIENAVFEKHGFNFDKKTL